MNQRVSPETLRILRNDVEITSVVHALGIPWRQDDMKIRFSCPICLGLDTSIHTEVNLGRCFSCQRNFNTIDLVMTKKNYPFRQSVNWLLALKNILKKDDGRIFLVRQALRSQIA